MTKVGRPSLQSSAQALSFNLQQLSETFQSQRLFLKEAHAYPLGNFPGLTQKDLLEQLLRKKLEPTSEAWVENHTTKYETSEHGSGLSSQELRGLWTWAAPASAGIVRPMLEDDGAFEDDFTIAEREAGIDSVVTGLRRKLDEGEAEDDDEDGDESMAMEEVVPTANGGNNAVEVGIDPALPAIPLDGMLRFMSKGALPNS